MPSASPEQHTIMEKWFGDPIGDTGPIEFLKSHGFKLLKDWTWEKPTPGHTISCYELECINFLCDEWDFGWVHNTLKIKPICLCGQIASNQ